jgi:hypothetical protein
MADPAYFADRSVGASRAVALIDVELEASP